MGIETAEACSCGGGEYSVVVATRGAPTFGEAPGGTGALGDRDAAARSMGTRVRTAGGVGGAWCASEASLIAFIYAESILPGVFFRLCVCVLDSSCFPFIVSLKTKTIFVEMRQQQMKNEVG
jgi:hypothetical protein